MKYWEVHVEGDSGAGYRKGQQEHLGPYLGHQVAETLSEEGQYLVITFDQGTRVRIPQRLVRSIVEG